MANPAEAPRRISQESNQTQGSHGRKRGSAEINRYVARWHDADLIEDWLRLVNECYDAEDLDTLVMMQNLMRRQPIEPNIAMILWGYVTAAIEITRKGPRKEIEARRRDFSPDHDPRYRFEDLVPPGAVFEPSRGYCHAPVEYFSIPLTDRDLRSPASKKIQDGIEEEETEYRSPRQQAHDTVKRRAEVLA